MHYSCMVVIPPGYTGDVNEYVERAMAPYDEQLEVEEYVEEDGTTYMHNPQSFWDWYQIGGRWTGHFARDEYDPELDRRNWEPCNICQGTGMRTDKLGNDARKRDPSYTCNACSGSAERGLPVGWRIKWPTEWVNDVGNIRRLGDVREYVEGEGRPYYLVHEGVSRSEVHNPDWDSSSGDYSDYLIATTDVEDVIKKLSDDCTLVVIDCHC